ncbi:uncharacterized protein LOC115634449 [Scaptodrosophila lebanonensis]|uniref:Uncharacterized protein LOC115634449 n=1 Tax=Drosophila lebanonensis TaxID=7225 RepID=A0A6J2UIG5_DROLE|nr:uncharacterized protein LOC115634449 [Scaptodrosophila lebanonensis]
MLLFLKMPHVRSLHIMPCCYHKLALSDARGKASFVHFPLSAALKGALEAGAGAVNVHFNRPFLRLACQQTSARWRHTSALEHAIHGRQMFLRALAEGLRAENELLVRRKSKGRLTEALNFEDVQESYQLRLEETAAPLSWQSKHEQHFQEIMARFANGQGPRLAEALTCLQTAMQKLCENVVLFDRLCYLEEAAVAQGLSVRARYEQLLDEKLSPRCFVLVAEKLT